jgi:ribosomal-protein-alanine N-acetyltransferase
MCKTIITNRLELRQFRDEDMDSFISIMTNPVVTRYLGDGRLRSRDEVIKVAHSFFEKPWEAGYGIFVVIEKAGGNIIGYCGIRTIDDGRVELLYGYAPKAWGKGYGTEAAKAVLDYGKKNFSLTELMAIAYPENIGSISVIKKLGFDHVGQEEHFGKQLELFTLKKEGL